MTPECPFDTCRHQAVLSCGHAGSLSHDVVAEGLADVRYQLVLFLVDDMAADATVGHAVGFQTAKAVHVPRPVHWGISVLSRLPGLVPWRSCRGAGRGHGQKQAGSRTCYRR